MGLIERHVTDNTKPMMEIPLCIVPIRIGNAPGLLGRFSLLEPVGMVTFFATQQIRQVVILQHLEMRGIGTQAVFGDHQLEVGGVWRSLTINRLAAWRSQLLMEQVTTDDG